MPRSDDLERMLRDLASADRRMMGAATRAAHRALRASVDAGYDAREDVTGKPYPLPKDGHRPPMERSGALRRAYRYLTTQGPGAWLLTVIERTDYGQFLRDGTCKMEPRQHIPRPGEPLPPSWAARFQVAVDEAVRRVWS